MEDNKLRFSLVVLLILMTCKPSPTVSETTAAPAPVETAESPATPESPDEPVQPSEPPARHEITIEHVDVANPVVITGRARTFENNVVLRVRDATGKLMEETFTTSDGEMGQHNPYRAEIWLTRDPGRRITVEALEYSAKDGSERSLVRAEKAFNVEVIEISIRLPNADCTGLVSARRRVPKSIAMARLLVESVMIHPMFQKGSAVRSMNLRDGVLTVDFNERLQNVGG